MVYVDEDERDDYCVGDDWREGGEPGSEVIFAIKIGIGCFF